MAKSTTTFEASMTAREGTACSNQFYETAASPTALSSITRRAVLLRDADSPIGFPFEPHQLVDGSPLD
jgi:hypothetical protein